MYVGGVWKYTTESQENATVSNCQARGSAGWVSSPRGWLCLLLAVAKGSGDPRTAAPLLPGFVYPTIHT